MTKVLGEATPVLTRRDTLGEGPAYDRVGGRLLWVDIHGHRVHELVADGDGAWRAGESWMMDAPVSAVVPHRDGGLVVAIGCEVRRLDADGTLTTIARIDTCGVSARLNDCKCDPRGRLLGGWLAYDLSEPGDSGAVWLERSTHAPVALHQKGTTSGPSFATGVDIVAVLSALGLTTLP